MTGVVRSQVADEQWTAPGDGPSRGPVGEDAGTRRSAGHSRFRRPLEVAGAAYVVLTAVTLAVGFLLTDVLHSIGAWDEQVNRAVVHDRAGTWNSITKFSTAAMNTLPVVAAVVLLVVGFAIARWWREAALVAIAMTLEITVFLSTTFTVSRPRPAVPRLNSTPATSSFPSGHTAAATVLCTVLALIITSHTSNRVVRVVTRTVAVVVVVAVGVARVYRGLHHPTDVVAGALLGVGCVAAALLAVRTAEPARAGAR